MFSSGFSWSSRNSGSSGFEVRDGAVCRGEGALCEEEGEGGQKEEEPEGWDQLDLDEEGGEDEQDQEEVSKEEHA